TPEAKEIFVKKLKEIVEKNGRLASTDTELAALLRDVIGYQGDPADKGKENDKATWLTTSSRAYRVRAKGIVGNQTRIVEFIMERQSIAQRKGSATPAPPWRLDGFALR
ncbi:MAG: hypothetical protein NTV34_02985, partial [Proteobacteria bacterium]|nr:hypothetical protein [Pseudomonadota bacterium]